MKYQTNQVNLLGHRKKNQDRVAIVEGEGEVLMVLADGLGGHQGGEIASQKCIDSFLEDFGRMDKPCADPKAFLKEAVNNAHQAIVATGMSAHPPIEPRTTCVACYIQNGVAHWLHIGDSRLYIFKGKQVRFRTLDHSFVEQLFQDGIINEVERATHPKRHAITRCLGGQSKPLIDFSDPTPLEPGDSIIMCSDGLWDPLGHHGIGDFLDDGDFCEAIEKMAHQAEVTASPRSDNISVAGFHYMAAENEAQTQAPQNGTKPSDGEENATENEQSLDDAIANMKESIAEYRQEIDQQS